MKSPVRGTSADGALTAKATVAESGGTVMVRTAQAENAHDTEGAARPVDRAADNRSAPIFGSLTPTASQELDQGDDQTTLGDQRAEQPFQKVGLHRLDGGSGLLAQGFHAGLDLGDIGLDRCDIGLGGEIGVEQGDMLFGQGLGLPLGEAALGQALDEAVGCRMRWPRSCVRS